MRSKAIYNAIKHGLLPYWMYETEKHYDCSYWQHLFINVRYAFRWITFRELELDIEFEKEINKAKWKNKHKKNNNHRQTKD